jgi:aldehyde:ferredoxin oxidoreductase
MDYVPRHVGGLGVAARIAWDELRPGIGPFDPENLLFLMVGPLTGTLASGGGRVVVAGIAPQQKPSVFSRSGMGGHWGAELKYAGFDGIVVRGCAEKPVYLWVHADADHPSGEAELRDAGGLWGRGTYATTTALRAEHGARTRVVSIGPAGEHLCRIASIETETGNAAGQGGYGAVMGAKRLKAIAVHGTSGVRVAEPARFMELCMRASREGMRPTGREPARGRWRGTDPGVTQRMKKCGFCITQCMGRQFTVSTGEAGAGAASAYRVCYGFRSPTTAEQARSQALVSDLGLNGWEIAFGIIPWLQMCAQRGLIASAMGHEISTPEVEIQYYRDVAPYSDAFAASLIRAIAYREGELGDALAEGACYAAKRLFGGAGVPLLDHIYPRHMGQTNHWNGHWGTGGNIYFPFWLMPVLQWCVDTRDPASDCTHGYSTHMLSYLPEHGPNRGPLTAEQVRAVCAKVYGEPYVGDPACTYDCPDTKAIPAIYHHDRGMLVESLLLCDKEHARVFSMQSEDYAADTTLMSRLYAACTGHAVSEAELDLAGERVFNLLRAIDVRDHGRSRDVDWATAQSLTHPAFTDGIELDLERFGPMLDRYYALRGWNPENGWPTRKRLEALSLHDVADSLEATHRLG